MSRGGIQVAHPDTIPGLAPDCRRILRDEYMAIQVAADADRIVEDDSYDAPLNAKRARTRDEISRDVARAIAEYRRVAEMWGVEVDA